MEGNLENFKGWQYAGLKIYGIGAARGKRERFSWGTVNFRRVSNSNSYE